MSQTTFDLLVIGGGPAGYVAAMRGAQLGLSTAIIETRKALGGTCLNIGCIPSKAMLNSSEHYHFALSEAKTHGVVYEKVGVDLAAMLARKSKVVGALTGGLDQLFKQRKIARFEGRGILLGSGKVRVEDMVGSDGPVELEATHVILATGSVPVELPHLPIDETDVVTSTGALEFEKVPASLIVIGAGAIGLELGSVWSRLGSKVTVIEFLPRIAPGFDGEIAKHLQRALTKQGLAFHLETKVTGLEKKDGLVHLTAEHGDKTLTFEAEKVLVAVGRRPFLEGCVAPDAGLELTKRGRVQVDEHYHTNLKNVYAIGDIIDGPMLAHKAEDEGSACVERIAGIAGHVNYDCIPGVVYTSPEASSVGISEEDAKEKGIEVRVGKFSFRANGRAISNGDVEGFVKLIADAKTDRLLGGHILHSAASELIAEVVSVMEFGGSSEDLARTTHAHPTLSEAVKEAALAVDGRALHSV